MNDIGENLKYLRLMKGLSLKQAGDLLNMSATAVSKYEKGLINVNSKKVIDFANAYNVKAIDILKVYTVPKIEFTSFRKKEKFGGQKLELLKKDIQNEIAKYFEVIKLSGVSDFSKKLKKYKCNNLTDAAVAANNFRKFIEISNKQPLPELIGMLENLGFVIIQIKNKNNIFSGFDGLCEIVENRPVIILLDDITDGARQRFTIAHELGHLLLDINGCNEEEACNSFASVLLMPKEAIINEFGITRKNISFYEINAFKNEFKVSYSAILHRLKDLNIISIYLYKKLYSQVKQINKENIKRILPEKSNQFKKMVHKLKANEVISLNKACELLGVNASEYNKEDNNY